MARFLNRNRGSLIGDAKKKKKITVKVFEADAKEAGRHVCGRIVDADRTSCEINVY